MSESELTAADRAPRDGQELEPWGEADLPSSEPLPSASPASASALQSEFRDLGSVLPLPHPRPFSSQRSKGGLLAAACSLAAHAFVIAALLLHAPWVGQALQDEDEISIELVDALPQPAPSPELVTSTDQAQAAHPESTPTETQATATPPAPQSEAPAAPPPETEASPPPLEAAPPPLEAQTPPPASSPPLEESETPPPPPPPAPVESPPAPVRATEPVRTLSPAADLAQRERAERLEREKREEAERATRERAARAAENAKHQEAQRQEAQRQAAERQATQRQEAQRQAAAKAAEASANAAAASAYRGIVIGHLASFKRYPPAARARGAQGSPAVSFTIDGSGRVMSVSLTRASGDPDIDAEIVAMVHRASPFPAPPPGAPHLFSAGVNFRLQ